MPVTSSGQISLNDLHIEVGGTSGTMCSFNDSDIRGLLDKGSSSQMRMNEWYGAQSAFPFTYSGNATTPQSMSTLASSAGWDGTVPVIMTIASSGSIHSNTTSSPSLTVDVAGSTVINNGKIAGKGGGANSNGGDAIKITVTGTTIQNNSGAFIAGAGGGGSGSGGGGGAGQSTLNSSSNSSSAGTGYLCYGGLNRTNGSASGCCATFGYSGNGVGGPQGGQGVSGSVWGSGSCASCGSFYGGGCGGVNLSGSATKRGATGGSVLSASSNANGAGSNGGGGWGQAGESGGGTGGDAIDTGYSYTYTNNGIVYGSV